MRLLMFVGRPSPPGIFVLLGVGERFPSIYLENLIVIDSAIWFQAYCIVVDQRSCLASVSQFIIFQSSLSISLSVVTTQSCVQYSNTDVTFVSNILSLLFLVYWVDFYMLLRDAFLHFQQDLDCPLFMSTQNCSSGLVYRDTQKLSVLILIFMLNVRLR